MYLKANRFFLKQNHNRSKGYALIIKTFLKALKIGFIICSLFCFLTDAQSQGDIEKRARQLEQQLQGIQDLNKLKEINQEAIKLLDDANKKTGNLTGMQGIAVKPAETPEKEMERRRDIINRQFHQLKNMLGSISSDEDEEKPQVIEALPLEGHILVEGGEKEMWYNDEVKTDLRYTIKEEFVGNLMVIHTYNPKKGRFDNERDYEIETISKEIKVSNLAGKKCIRWSSGSPAICTGWANFLRYEVDKGEYYPQFHSRVVSANTGEDGLVEIEAGAPNVVFLGSDGVTKASMGCFGAKWKIDRKDFERLFKGGAISLNKDIGSKEKSTPGCRPGSTITLYLKIKDEKTDVCKDRKSIELKIVSPEEKGRYVFSDEYLLDEHSNKLTLELEAKTIPEHYADSVEWTIPEIEGSNRTIIPNTQKGRKLTVTYKGLPNDYREFGRKKIRAALNVDSCKIEETREVQFFYPRDAKNNPEGKYPNWFYYWRQTPAARPFGQNVRIEYHCAGIPMDKCACLQKGVIGQYNPYYSGYKTVNVCNLETNTWDSGTFFVQLPAVKRSKASTLTERNYFPYTYIDTFAVAIMHEFTHFNNFLTFWPDGWKESEDRDGDDIPDRLELGMGFDPNKKQTYWDGVDLIGDEEFLTLEATYDYQVGTFDEYDWAKPGKNWPK
ncbi:MAG: helix-loop-helix domain-containing protein [Syntrophorhabdaceae bacterium]|nr:helix-loop-helix domain-containing protein [Syntrophorhabdaceae bacterium]